VTSLTNHLLSIAPWLISNGAVAEPDGLLSLCSHARFNHGDAPDDGGELSRYALVIG